MQAAVYRGRDDVRLEELPVPEPGPGEVLLRVAACGVCGTDLKKIRYGLADPPRVFGHETAGVVAEVGPGVTSWSAGDRVAVNHHVPCQSFDCFFCARGNYAQCPTYRRTGVTAGFEPAGGGFAGYVRVMDWCVQRGMTRVPDFVPLEAATFLEPLNTCLKAVRLAAVRPGDTALVMGQGPIGLLFSQLLRREGAQVVATDPLPFRREMAMSLGANSAFAPGDRELRGTIDRLSDRRGADLAMVAVADTRVVAEAFDAVRPGGKVLLFAQTRLQDAVAVDAGAICMQEKALIGSYSSDITLQEETASLLFERTVLVEPLISHRFALSQIDQAIAMASSPRDGSLKVLVIP